MLYSKSLQKQWPAAAAPFSKAHVPAISTTQLLRLSSADILALNVSFVSTMTNACLALARVLYPLRSASDVLVSGIGSKVDAISLPSLACPAVLVTAALWRFHFLLVGGFFCAGMVSRMHMWLQPVVRLRHCSALLSAAGSSTGHPFRRGGLAAWRFGGGLTLRGLPCWLCRVIIAGLCGPASLYSFLFPCVGSLAGLRVWCAVCKAVS